MNPLVLVLVRMRSVPRLTRDGYCICACVETVMLLGAYSRI